MLRQQFGPDPPSREKLGQHLGNVLVVLLPRPEQRLTPRPDRGLNR
jgi:hypothetical protein